MEEDNVVDYRNPGVPLAVADAEKNFLLETAVKFQLNVAVPTKYQLA